MKVEEQRVVAKAAQDLIGSLPVDGKLDVLNHLIGQLSAKNLEGLSAKSRERLLQVLPEAGKQESVTTTQQAALDIAPHELCNLVVKGTKLGRNVSFVIPQGMSGRQILEAIEKANPQAEGDGVVWPESTLLRDAELDTVATSNVEVKFTVFFKFNYMTRSEQHEKLAEKYHEFTPRWQVTLAAALYRDANGFPPDDSDIGTSSDAGDLFKGLYVRVAPGELHTYQNGLHADDGIDDNLDDNVVAAGSPLSNVMSDRRNKVE